MLRIASALVMLTATGVLAASSTLAESPSTQSKHYRLTFVVTYPEKNHAPQTFTLDVPVSQARRGMAQTSSASILTGAPETAIEETLLCTDVEESTTGLEARVSFASDASTPSQPGQNEPIHHKLLFNRLIDVELGKPTVITEEMHRIALDHGKQIPDPQSAPQSTITVTATQI